MKRVSALMISISPTRSAKYGQKNGSFKSSRILPAIDVRRARWDNPTMVVTLDAKRRLTVPAALAPAKPGDYFDAHFDAEEDSIVFRRLGGRESWLAVMKECPV